MNVEKVVRDIQQAMTAQPPLATAIVDQMNAQARDLFTVQEVPWTQDAIRGFMLGAIMRNVMSTEQMHTLITCVAMQVEL